ncbi:hypothetical protein FDZ71_13065 [bacterium]|nr:MAG: hypothetical protein FDZ71_13065 [bacterium]
MTVTVPLCVRHGCERSIRSVKAKSRNELALEHAILSSIDEHFVKIVMEVEIRHFPITLEFVKDPRRTAPRPQPHVTILG